MFWTPADVTNLVEVVLKNMPASANVQVKVNGKAVPTNSVADFVAKAAAIRQLHKEGGRAPVPPPGFVRRRHHREHKPATASKRRVR